MFTSSTIIFYIGAIVIGGIVGAVVAFIQENDNV